MCIDVLVAQGLWHERLDDGKFHFFLRHQIVAAGIAVLVDGIAELFAHLVEDPEHRGVIEFDAFVDFLLLDGGRDQAQRAESFLVPVAHGNLDLVVNLFFECSHESGRLE